MTTFRQSHRKTLCFHFELGKLGQGKPVFRKKIEFDREDDVVPYLPMLMTWDLNHDGLDHTGIGLAHAALITARSTLPDRADALSHR